MTGWNLPPGCRTSDIPGNRPEDEEYEIRHEKIYEKALSYKFLKKISQKNLEKMLDSIEKLMDEAFKIGYFEGERGEREAQNFEKYLKQKGKKNGKR